jgi:hypothetical protein
MSSRETRSALPLDKAIQTARGPLVLLFYDGFEMQANPGIAGAIYSRARGAARYLYRTIRQKQVYTGFYTAFRSLRASLLQAGCNVRVNDFALTRRHPSYPIGLVGYPSVLSKVALPNPAVFGPGDCGTPEQAACLLRDTNIRRLIQPCEWAAAIYRKTCGESMLVWPAGIDTDAYADASGHPKDIDVVVYDKLRWYREREVPRILERVTQHLAQAGRSFEVLRYGAHHQGQFLTLVRRSRALLFLCEHETQGLAYQEAMSCNVPVLAWDEGVLVDPQQQRFIPPGLTVTSVPYFDERCGERFKIDEFESAFQPFWEKLPRYSPRQYVLDHLSLSRSAQSYLEAYASLIP